MVEENYYKNWLEEHYPFDHKEDLTLLYEMFEDCYENGYYEGKKSIKDFDYEIKRVLC